MSKYNITYKCGHTATINICGPTKDRDRKAAWYAEQDCPECRRAKENADAAAKAEAADRPELAGSEKQVAWANTIREKAIDSISNKPSDAQNDVATIIYSRLREQFNHDEAKIEARGKEIADKLGDDKQAAIVALLLDAANAVTDAKEWIDNRQDTVEYLANIVAVKLIGSDVDKAPVTLEESQFGRCKNGSYYVRTRGYEINTDLRVNTELAFLDAELVTDNGDGTISVAKDALDHALDIAAWKTAQRIGVGDENVEIHVAKVKK